MSINHIMLEMNPFFAALSQLNAINVSSLIRFIEYQGQISQLKHIEVCIYYKHLYLFMDEKKKKSSKLVSCFPFHLLHTVETQKQTRVH